METCKSARTVFRHAHAVACEVWKPFSHRFSRHDFQLPQLFACLVVREFFQLSYRKTEEFFGDSPDWLADIGMSKAPDHNTLWRAFGVLLKPKKCASMLDLLVALMKQAGELKLREKPLTLDSTCFDPHHRSRHYDQRCRKMNLRNGDKYGKNEAKTANRRRRQTAKRQPKLASAVAASCHFILAARTCIGQGADHPDFIPLLEESNQRARVKDVAADSGYDSHRNHAFARETLKVRSIIPSRIGRPSDKLPTSRYRRNMKQRFHRGADKRVYGQRAQSETVHSMLKRNLGDALRSILTLRRKKEMHLLTLTHNLMLLANARTG